MTQNWPKRVTHSVRRAVEESLTRAKMSSGNVWYGCARVLGFRWRMMQGEVPKKMNGFLS